MIQNVSRETMEMLQEFANLLLKWNKAINLIAKSTAEDAFNRHVLDSYQITRHIQFGKTWLDMGSGGGLPGIVLAIAAKAEGVDTEFTLVESDQRKCAFLRNAAVEFDLNAKIVAKRVEQHSQPAVSHVSARALAPLSQLLTYAQPFADDDTIYVFPKGQNHIAEVNEARNSWTFDAELIESDTQASSAIVIIRNLQ